MGSFIGTGELLYLIGYLIIAMLIAAIATFVAGRLSDWRYPNSAVAFGAFHLPVMIIGYMAYVIRFYPDGPPPNDAKGTAAGALVFLAMVTLPFTLASSVYAWRRAPR